MPLPTEPVRTPTAIRDISIELADILNAEGGHDYSATYHVQVQMSDGSIRVITGDLIPHITTQQRTGLLNFMIALRAQAEEQVLP